MMEKATMVLMFVMLAGIYFLGRMVVVLFMLAGIYFLGCVAVVLSMVKQMLRWLKR